MMIDFKLALNQALQRLPQGRVLVVGDLALDEMIFGTTSRLSREAPVIILDHQHTDIILGAAANAAHNVTALGARCHLVGVAGQDYYGDQLRTALDRDRVTAQLIIDAPRPTTVKSRISGIAHQSITQQMVRIDRGYKQLIHGDIEQSVLQAIQQIAPTVDVLLLSDYGLGVLTPAVIACCQSMARQYRLSLVADSQGHLAQFKGANIICPNQLEAEQNLGLKLDTATALAQGGQILLNDCGTDYLLITLGDAGMALFSHDAPMQRIPVFNHSHVFDVTGAGDTVTATIALAVATGASMLEAAFLGNLAASIVVKRFGAATTNIHELQGMLAKIPDELFTDLGLAEVVQSH